MKNYKQVSFILTILMVLAVVGCAPTNTREGTGEYIDDTVITTKVKAAIVNDPDLSSFEINVETFKGVVQLSGFVSTKSDIDKAIKLAREVKGVNSVKNDMHLKERAGAP
jgi:osmotically-inducible protein OsmY